MVDLIDNLGYSYVIGYAFPSEHDYVWYTIREHISGQFLGLDIIGIRYG